MNAALDRVETLVLLMLENRSFDHMLGYLGLSGPGRLPVDGLSADPAWLQQHANMWRGTAYPPFQLDAQRIPDPPHERDDMALQIGTPPAPGRPPPLDGFVASFMRQKNPPGDPSLVMGYYTAAAVPVLDFLARSFTVCDHWFSAIPTGTQPNRLMAMSGETSLADNTPYLLPDQELVYDWLTARGVSWCSYQSGPYLPFLSLMPRWQEVILASLALNELGGRGRFRRLKRFRDDWTSRLAMPQVIFIEPEYTDGPRTAPNDDHPPTPVAPGQQLVADVHDALIANPERWSRTVLIVTYDEHGGFYDHVPPLPVPTEVPRLGPAARFTCTGLRVPGLIVSPFVEPGSVYSGPLDHTSILQLLAERFDPGRTYSAAVSSRQPLLSPLSAALTRTEPRREFQPAPPVAAATERVAEAGMPAEAPAADVNARALYHAGAMMVRSQPQLVAELMPQLAAYLEGPPAPA